MGFAQKLLTVGAGLGLWAISTMSALAATTAYTGATVVHTDGPGVIKNAVVVITDNRITAVGKAGRVKIPKGAEKVDVRGKWIVPGYVDAHVHFFQSGSPYTRPDGLDFREIMPYQEEIDRNIAELPRVFSRYLASGITSVIDVGGPMWNFDARKLAGKLAKAPRVQVAGPLLSARTPGPLKDTDDLPILGVSTPEEAREIVAAQAAEDVDFIKLWINISSPDCQGERCLPSLEQQTPWIDAAIDEANKRGIKVAVHAMVLDVARFAAERDIDLLVHGVGDQPVDQDFLNKLKREDISFTSSIVVVEGYAEVFGKSQDFSLAELNYADPYALGAWIDLRHSKNERVQKFLAADTSGPAAKMANDVGVVQANLLRAHQAGVRTVVGTDAGNPGTFHGPSIFREFELMVEAGMSPRDILVAATQHGAELMGMAEEIGSISAGKLADFLVLAADPTKHVDNLSAIESVVVDGTAYARDAIIEETAEDLVQRQLNAYNRRDIEGFLAPYSDNLHLYQYPDKLLTSDQQQIRQNYVDLFTNAPDLHCEIVDRMVVGNTVIDQEHVTGIPGRDPLNAIAIYQVEDGRIVRVAFVSPTLDTAE